MTTTATIARSPLGARPSRATVQPVTASFVPEAMLTWQTVMALSGLSESSLRRLRAVNPSFPRLYRLAGCARFRAADVRAWLAAQKPEDSTQRDRPPRPAATTTATQ